MAHERHDPVAAKTETEPAGYPGRENGTHWSRKRELKSSGYIEIAGAGTA
jgi:hypothetical protein